MVKNIQNVFATRGMVDIPLNGSISFITTNQYDDEESVNTEMTEAMTVDSAPSTLESVTRIAILPPVEEDL